MIRWISKKSAVIGLLALGCATTSVAEIRQSVQIDLQNTIANGGGETLYLATGSGQLKLQSIGNKNVRGYLGLSADIGETSSVELDRVYVKTRYDSLKITAGKTRLSWGEGTVFNAGDVVVGSSDLALNLAATEFRSNSRWLVSLSKAHGRFSFTELVILPAEPDSMNPISSTDISRATAALRTQFQIPAFANTKVELGYAIAGEHHQPYVSLQGGKGINWHLSANLQQDGAINSSAGVYLVKDIGEQSTLNLRTELLIQPSAESDEQPNGDHYIAYGYVELGLSTGSNVSYFSRNLISPIDRCALLMFGTNINLHQGLNLFSNLSLQLGDDDDVFSSEAVGAQSVTVGLSFVF